MNGSVFDNCFYRVNYMQSKTLKSFLCFPSSILEFPPDRRHFVSELCENTKARELSGKGTGDWKYYLKPVT